MYCVVPTDLAPELHELLCDHWRDDPSVVVMVERRRGERRRSRNGHVRSPERRARSNGRAGGDRREAAHAQPPPGLPRPARLHADRLAFKAPNGRARRDAEDVDSDRLVVRLQSGDRSAFDRLFMRYYDRVYAYARVALRDEHEAEDVAQQVFGNVIQALPRYQVRHDSSFRAWLFRITRNVVLRTLSRNGRLCLEEPAELDRRLESPTPDAPFGLDWLSDKDLAMLVERLPLSQRQVILLRYVFQFRTDEIAEALERTPVAIRMLEHRATRALEARLDAMRGNTRRCERSPMIAYERARPVVFRRRFALSAIGGAPL